MPQATDDTGANGSAPYYSANRSAAIRQFVLWEMLRGAGWAGMVVVAIGLLLWGTYLVGLLLPDASKTAPPPMPYSLVQPMAGTATG